MATLGLDDDELKSVEQDALQACAAVEQHPELEDGTYSRATHSLTRKTLALAASPIAGS